MSISRVAREESYQRGAGIHSPFAIRDALQWLNGSGRVHRLVSSLSFRSGTYAVTLPMWTVPGRADLAAPGIRGRSGQVRAGSVDDLARHRLTGSAAAVQGRAGLPESEVRASAAARPRTGDGSALRRRAGR